VVEDEANTREGLAFLIRQKMTNCSVYEAIDGMDGLSKNDEYKPDIIITDIKMPKMDGIAMILQLRNQGCTAQFIIISGYAEFQYAQAALSLGVSGYILKPVVPSMVFELLEKCCEAVKKEKQNNQSFKRENWDLQSDEDIRMLSRFYDQQHADKYIISQVYFQRMPSLKNDIILQCVDNENLLILNLHEQHFIGIIAPFGKTGNALIHKLESIIQHYHGAVCVYGFVNTLDTVLERLDKLHETIRWSISTGKNMMCEDEVVLTAESRDFDSNDFKKAFNKLCFLCDYEKCKQMLLKYIVQIQKRGINPEAIIQLTVSCLLQLNEKKSPTAQGNMRCFEAVNNTLSAYSFQDIEYNINKHFQSILSSQNDMTTFSKPVVIVIDEINRSYNQLISLNSIAEKLGVTPQYLSRIFTKETNSNFIDYLTMVRIEKAKSFIKNTDLKIYEIAQRVGYPDSKYFCTIFKKVAGIPPNQFKRIATMQKNSE